MVNGNLEILITVNSYCTGNVYLDFVGYLVGNGDPFSKEIPWETDLKINVNAFLFKKVAVDGVFDCSYANILLISV